VPRVTLHTSLKLPGRTDNSQGGTLTHWSHSIHGIQFPDFLRNSVVPIRNRFHLSGLFGLSGLPGLFGLFGLDGLDGLDRLDRLDG